MTFEARVREEEERKKKKGQTLTYVDHIANGFWLFSELNICTKLTCEFIFVKKK